MLGAETTWAAQRPLAQRMRLDVLVRHGYRPGVAAAPDYLHDAADLLTMLAAEPAHLVGHCYGALACVLAAAGAPDRVLSLTLIEPTCLAELRHPAVEALRLRWRERPRDPLEFAATFGTLAGLPRGRPRTDDHWAAVSALRMCRPAWDAALPLPAIARAGVRTLVLSGGHSPALTAVAATVSARTGGEHLVLPGNDHAVQHAGAPFNERLEQHLTGAPN